LGVFVALFALGATRAGAADLEGPQVTLLSMSLQSLKVSLLSIDPENSQTEVLLSQDLGDEPSLDPSSAVAWSPDGTRLAVAATSLKKAFSQGGGLKSSIFLLDPGSGKMRPVRGAVGGSDPVFSRDGTALAFKRTRELRKPNGKLGERPRFKSSSVWVTDLSNGSSRRLTPWRNGLAISPSSFSPDGLMLGATREAGHRPDEAVALPLDGGPMKVLARPGMDPTYSPDGSKIVYVDRHGGAPTDVYEMNADGSGSVQLTDTPSEAELGLAWSPSGTRLAFIRLSKPARGASILDLRSGVVEMNADGGCERTLFSKKTLSLSASWRPGPGRDPGPIAC
jgi:TolB protein